jgi:uncharacterized protein (DUF362 family)
MTARPTRVSVVKAPTSYDDREGVRDAVESALAALELAPDVVRPGDRVVLKPNWVKEHDERHPGPDRWEHVVTHPVVIDAVMRWVGRRLDREGSITVCDAPQTDSSFDRIRAYCRLDELVAACRRAFPGIEINLLDLRPEEWHAVDGVTVSKRRLDGDPRGSTQVHLDEASEFVGYSGNGHLYGASYNVAETNAHHDGLRHDYLLCRTPMEADVFINLPKLKTHKKVGVTCSLKGLVGINANKNWLPHHTEGTPDRGGDQFPAATAIARLEHAWMGRAKRMLKNRPRVSWLFVPAKKLGRMAFGDTQRVVRSGNWHGNDTCWRMVLDLNKCFFWFDGDGRRRATPIRYLSVVDGVVGGEGNGPMAPDRKPCGAIIVGTSPVAVDCVAATLMGFDWRRIRLLERAFEMRSLSFVPFAPGDVEIVSDHEPWAGSLDGMDDVFSFRPHFGWVGAIERRTEAVGI